MEDGLDHINVYSQGKTELGRWLSNFTKAPINLPEDGYFLSIEGYWYWLKTKDEKLRTLYGYEAKKYGRNAKPNTTFFPSDIAPYLPNFQDKIKLAIKTKVLSNLVMKTKFIESTLPFKHYYVFDNRIVEAGHGWQMEYLENLRSLLSQNSQ